MIQHRVRPVVDLFVERARDDEAQVHFCGPDRVEETLAEVLGGRSTAVPRRFPWWVPRSVSPRCLDRVSSKPIQAVATTAALGVATTGTLVLTRGRRVLELEPELHVCVLLADQVVTGVPEAIAALNPHARQTWISGPRADHEIELERVDALLSSRALHVVLVDQDASAA